MLCVLVKDLRRVAFRVNADQYDARKMLRALCIHAGTCKRELLQGSGADIRAVRKAKKNQAPVAGKRCAIEFVARLVDQGKLRQRSRFRQERGVRRNTTRLLQRQEPQKCATGECHGKEKYNQGFSLRVHIGGILTQPSTI